MTSFTKCYICSILVVLISVEYIDRLKLQSTNGVTLLVILSGIVAIIGPVENEDFPMNEREAAHLKKGIIVVEIIIVLVTFLGDVFKGLSYYDAAVVAQIVIIGSMILKKGKQ